MKSSLFDKTRDKVQLIKCTSIDVCILIISGPTFHLSEHFLEKAAKAMVSSGCFLRCSSLHVCTKYAYDDMRPRGLSDLARGISAVSLK